jgi:hypothetical protein
VKIKIGVLHSFIVHYLEQQRDKIKVGEEISVQSPYASFLPLFGAVLLAAIN